MLQTVMLRCCNRDAATVMLQIGEKTRDDER